jgi:predicted  nucleic acid-binding Zn-ribbon protein
LETQSKDEEMFGENFNLRELKKLVQPKAPQPKLESLTASATLQKLQKHRTKATARAKDIKNEVEALQAKVEGLLAEHEQVVLASAKLEREISEALVKQSETLAIAKETQHLSGQAIDCAALTPEHQREMEAMFRRLKAAEDVSTPRAHDADSDMLDGESLRGHVRKSEDALLHGDGIDSIQNEDDTCPP